MGRKKVLPEDDPDRELSAKEKLFVERYLHHGKAGRAYREAISKEGSIRTSANNAWKLMKKAYIKRAIAEGYRKIYKESQMESDQAIAEISAIANFNLVDCFSFRNGAVEMRRLDQLPLKDQKCISQIEIIPTPEGNKIRVKAYNKTAALEQLCKKLGLFNEARTLDDALLKFLPATVAATVSELVRQIRSAAESETGGGENPGGSNQEIPLLPVTDNESSRDVAGPLAGEITGGTVETGTPVLFPADWQEPGDGSTGDS